MYLASLKSESMCLFQGCVQLVHPQAVGVKAKFDWTHTLERCLSSITAMSDANFALRVVFRDNRIQCALLTTSSNQTELKNRLLQFGSLNSIAKASVLIPRTREEHDGAWGSFFRRQCRATSPSFSLPNTWFACDFKVGPFLDEVFLELAPLNYGLSYQVHVRNMAFDPSLIVTARKNATRISRLVGANSDLIEMQEGLARQLVNASAVVEEFLGVESPDAGRLVGESMKRHFDAQFSRFQFESPHFDFTENSFEDEVALGLHSSFQAASNAAEVCASAVQSPTAVQLINWSPSDRLHEALVAEAQPSNTETEMTLRIGSGFDVFLSHNSKDKPVVRQLGEALRIRNLNVWLDEWELRPGLPWQDELEVIVATCKSAMVCVGGSGIGPWEDPEMKALLRRFVNEKKLGNVLPIIPVLLPGAPSDVKLPIFLGEFTWVDLRCGLTNENLDLIEWGITGSKRASR